MKTQWQTEYRCVSCKKPVTYEQKMRSHGRCPLCGYKDAEACTIMKTTERAYRLVRRALWWQPRPASWWQFWVRPTREYQFKNGERLRCGTCTFHFDYNGVIGGCPSCGNMPWTEDLIPLY